MKRDLIPNTAEDALYTKRFVLTKWFVFWLLLTFVGLVITVSFLLGRSAVGQPLDVLNLLNTQMFRFQVWAAFAPAIIWFDHRYRARSRSWTFLFPAHFATSLVWAAVVACVYCLAAWLIDGLINSRWTDFGEFFIAAGVLNFVMGIVGYKIILTTNYALDYYKKFQDERHRSARLEAQLVRAQLAALKMQLQPHFLFNTLNSISDMALEDPRKTVQMIARLGDFLRLTVETNGTQQTDLEQELVFLKNYLEIEQIRFRDRLRIEYDIPPETLPARVPNLILQPLVENAIKHGIAKSLGAGKITIRARTDGRILRLEIRNDGSPAANGRGGREGIGIANTRERLEQFYGHRFRFWLRPLKKGGAAALLEIPFDSEPPHVAAEEDRRPRLRSAGKENLYGDYGE